MSTSSPSRCAARRLRVPFLCPSTGTSGEAPSPVLLLSTRGGAVPHLTPETVHLAALEGEQDAAAPAPILVAANYVAKSAGVLKKTGRGVSSFMGFPGRPSFLTVQDPHDPPPRDLTENKGVTVLYRGQRMKLNTKTLVEAAREAKPAAMVALCDGQTPPEASAKRLSKSVNRSVELLDDCLGVLDKDGDSTAVFGAIEGGRSAEWRRRSCELVSSRRRAAGFLLDGFFLAPEEEDPSGEDLGEVARLVREEVSPRLPEDKPRAFLGPLGPRAVVELAAAGVDVFDSTYATDCAEKGWALTFPFPRREGEERSAVSEDLPVRCEEEGLSNEDVDESPGLLLDLNEPCFKEDFSPIIRGCSCIACRRHTRAYISHLFATKELLGPALLAIHNLHHYSAFFRAMGRAIEEGEFERVRTEVLECYERDPPRHREEVVGNGVER